MGDDEQRMSHWRRTTALAGAVMAGMVALALVAPLLTGILDKWSFLRFPLGYYLAAQGAIVVFVLLAYWFAARQERTDRRYGASEDA